MNVYELCQRNVVTVRRHEDLAHAAWIMRERNVGCLVVIEPAGGGNRPIGILSDRDIVTSIIARRSDPFAALVEDAMARLPPTLPMHASVDDALQRMRASGMRRMPVVDERGRLMGILALDDIFDQMSRRAPQAVTPLHRDQRATP